MKKTRFYPNIWTAIPYTSHVLSDWYGTQDPANELILKNSHLEKLGVSKMDLSVTKLSFVDIQGNEHESESFSGEKQTSLKELVNGSFVKLSNFGSIKPGVFDYLRLYLAESDNRFVYSTGEGETVNNISYLDFKIENGFEIKLENNLQIKLWFQLTPFHFGSYFKPFTDVFKKLKGQLPRLVNPMG